jgi:ribosomal protein L10
VANAQNKESVEELKARFAGVQTAVLTEYRGLSVRQLSDLRKQLKGAAAEYKVVKNRLARIAIKGSPLDGLGNHLTGPTGVAYTRKDPVPVAKALQAFLRNNPALTIKVGMIEGRVVEPAALRSLAELPSKDALRAQLVGAVQGPMGKIVTLLTAVQGELARVLEARSKQGAAE